MMAVLCDFSWVGSALGGCACRRVGGVRPAGGLGSGGCGDGGRALWGVVPVGLSARLAVLLQLV